MSEIATTAAPRETVLVDGEPMKVTAFLDGALKISGLTSTYLAGEVMGDLLKRFKDGAIIHTSPVKEEVQPGVFLTRSRNLYRVRSWLQPQTQEA